MPSSRNAIVSLSLWRSLEYAWRFHRNWSNDRWRFFLRNIDDCVSRFLEKSSFHANVDSSRTEERKLGWGIQGIWSFVLFCKPKYTINYSTDHCAPGRILKNGSFMQIPILLVHRTINCWNFSGELWIFHRPGSSYFQRIITGFHWITNRNVGSFASFAKMEFANEFQQQLRQLYVETIEAN